MSTTLEVLLTTLVQRFVAAGLDVPEGMTAEKREAFVFEALAACTILPADDYERLVAAARAIVDSWERGPLAEAVRNLDIALGEKSARKA